MPKFVEVRTEDWLATTKDAARYRWLRNEDNPVDLVHSAMLVIPHGEMLDTQIDAAMSNKGEQVSSEKCRHGCVRCQVCALCLANK